MKITAHGLRPWLGREMTVLLLSAVLAAAQTVEPQTPGPSPAEQGSGSATQPAVGAPASPAQPRTPDASGRAPTQNATPSSAEPLPDSPGSVQGQSAYPAQRPPAQPALPTQIAPPAGGPEPAGTAAAGIVTTTGVAASKPAGTAIAPAKQRRIRVMVLAVGAIVGASVAVGATMALSKGSPSRPPGSR